MKKFLTFLLATLFIVSLSFNVYAAPASQGKDVVVGIIDNNGTPDDPSDDKVIKEDGDTDGDGDVDADDDPVSTVTKVYSVNVAWGELVFNITVDDADNVEWNSESRVYDITDGSWQKTTENIKVTNNSNATLGVTANFANGKSATQNGVTATLSDSDTRLASAVGTSGTTAPAVTYEVKITSPVPASVPTLSFTVDVITVTFSE